MHTMAFIRNVRFSGGTHGFVIGHVTPEAQTGGLIGLVENGDTITIDADDRSIDVDLSEEEIQRRRKNWTAPTPTFTTGVLRKYSKTVSTASLGCVTDL